MHPPVGTMGRIALQDTLLPYGGGPTGESPVFVKQGEIAETSFYALHRNQDIFGDDVDSFRPERWEYLRPGRWNFMPFGGGPRVCPGQQLALAASAYVIVRLAQEFECIENRDPVVEFVEQYKIVTESKNGAKVAFVLPSV